MDYALFQVAVKVILRDGDKILTLTTNDGYLDFPGGRLNDSEMELDHKEAVKREITEELGREIKVTVGNLAFVSRRSYSHEGQKNYVMAVYYEATLNSGEISLSEEHSNFHWASAEEIANTSLKYMSTDEEAQLKNYFAK